MKSEEVVVTMTKLDDLPEDCISTILSFTSPLDACRSSVVSSIFKSASESDDLWERFLPSDYQEIISRSSSSSSTSRFPSSSKKELYFHLSDNPILIDGGKKSFQIEKSTGNKCFMIAARELFISWGDTPGYWSWKATSGSRFGRVAFLNHVGWLEICGKIDTETLSRNTTYGCYLVFRTANLKGFDYDAPEASVRFLGDGGDGECSGERAIYFALDGSKKGKRLRYRRECEDGRFGLVLLELHLSVKRRDRWMEIELGDFFNGDEGEAGEIEMSLMETNCGCTKSGLIVQGIEVRPRGSTLSS